MTRAVETYNETPALNNFDIDEGGAPEGHQRVKVNDSNRERMSALASFYQDGIEWLDLLRDPTDRSIQFTVAQGSSTTIEITSGSLDLTALFNVGRRIKTTTAGADTDELEVLSFAPADPVSTVTIYSAGGDTVTAGIDGLLLHSSTRLKRFAFLDTLPTAYILVDGLTDADFATALATAVTNGGGTILLKAGQTVLTQGHDVPINTRILGQGIGASELFCNVNTVDFILRATGSQNHGFESFTLRGTAGGVADGHGILFPDTDSHARERIRDVYIVTVAGDGIRIEEDPTPSTRVCRDFVIDGVIIESPGGNGIFCDNPNTNVERCQMSNITVFNTGGATGTSYGIIVSGRWSLVNINVSDLDSASPAIQVGLALTERLATPPNEADSNQCQVSNFYCEGTGQDARGVDMNGRFCSVIGGSIVLTGSASKGILIAGTLGQQQANNNRAQGLAITASVGFDETASPAFQNEVLGCQFNACGIDVRIGGANTLVQGNQMKGATLQSIRLVSGSSRARVLNNDIFDNTGIGIECLASTRALIKGNSVYGSASHGVSVAAASDRTVVDSNYLEACAGDGVNVASGSTVSRISHNECVDIVGSDYVNSAGTDAYFHDNAPQADELFTEKTSDQSIVVTSIVNISGLIALPFPSGDGGPDGKKQYMVEGCLIFDTVTERARIKLHMGATGNNTDAVQSRWEIAGAVSADRVVLTSQFVVTPASGELASFSSTMLSAGGMNILGSASADDEKSTVLIRRWRSEA